MQFVYSSFYLREINLSYIVCLGTKGAVLNATHPMCLTSRLKQQLTFTLNWPRLCWSKLEATPPPPFSPSRQPVGGTKVHIETYTYVPLRLACTLLASTTLSHPTGCPGPIPPMCPGSLVSFSEKRVRKTLLCIHGPPHSLAFFLFLLLLSGQAMEIGSAALNILVECWDGHLTPPEVASLADRASRARDPNMVRAAAELALSCLPHAHALNPNEIQRALVQCKEQVLWGWLTDDTDTLTLVLNTMC